jgi:hypothetical protein
MDKKLKKLISDYQASVRTAVELIERSGIPLPVTSRGWVDTDIPAHDELEGGVSYYKHGNGCLVDLPSGSVDFDFGKIGEIDGFDSCRLVKFSRSELAKYGFESEDAVEKSFEAAVKSGSLVSSGYILYYVTESECTLAIEIGRDIPNDPLPHYDQDKVVALNVHSFLAADSMRENYKKLSSKLEKNKDLSQKDEVEFRIYFSSWLGYLYSTCERFEKSKMSILLAENRPESFRELIAKSEEITRLMKLHKDSLRKLRNNVFHTREDVKPILRFAADDASRLSWAGELHSAMAEFFSMYRILCEVHYLTHDRLGESQVRKQHAKKKGRSNKQG